MSTGYAHRVVTLRFDDLAEADENGEASENLFIVLRNPKLVPLADILPAHVNQDGTANTAEAMAMLNDVASKLIIGWRMYDCAGDIAIDPDTGEDLSDEQQLLPLPATPDLVGKLPGVAQTRLQKLITEAINPQ